MIKKRLPYTKILLYSLACACLWISCRKQEFMPPPVGEPIAFADSSLTLPEYMGNHPSYSLFWKAIRKSNIEKLINENNPNYNFTLFLPSNSAMTAAGFGDQYLNSASKTTLDSLVGYHISLIKLLPKDLAIQSGNLEINTIIKNDTYNEAFLSGRNFDTKPGFIYRYYLSIENGTIRINNQAVGDASESLVLKKGTVIPINRVLKKVRKSTRQILVEDGRFKLYLNLRRYNDSVYKAMTGFIPSKLITVPYERNQYVRDNIYAPLTMLDYLSDINYASDENAGIIPFRDIYPLTLLVPTDEAFHNAGFRDFEDLLSLNRRALPELLYNENTGEFDIFSGYLPTDSILRYHFWGTVGNAKVRTETPNPISGKPERFASSHLPNTGTLFFSNMLKNERIGDYRFDSFQQGLASSGNPLDFTRNGETISVRVKGSSAEPAIIIDKDIETFNGVIHVLNRLLIPSGFRLK
jgi:uncharacterized surface protein with fasciclin (FAS1) repeats